MRDMGFYAKQRTNYGQGLEWSSNITCAPAEKKTLCFWHTAAVLTSESFTDSTEQSLGTGSISSEVPVAPPEFSPRIIGDSAAAMRCTPMVTS